MRGFERAVRIAFGAALAFAGCSSRNLVAVDPYPCADGEATGCAPGLLDDLIGFWRLNDPLGSTMARDWSGWRNDGMLVGIDPTSAWGAPGPEGSALSVGATGHLTVPRSASIDSIATQVTVAAWMYLDGTVMEYATAISRQIGAGFEQHYHLSVNVQNQAILFITTSESGQAVLGGPRTVPQRTWIHVAGTYDGREARLYVDGVQVAALPATGTFGSETNAVILAGNANTPARTVSELVPGRLNDIMLYRRALAPDEIMRIRNGALLASTGAPPDAASP